MKYISLELYIICPKYVSFGTNGFDVRDKSKRTENIKSLQTGET